MRRLKSVAEEVSASIRSRLCAMTFQKGKPDFPIWILVGCLMLDIVSGSSVKSDITFENFKEETEQIGLKGVG